MVNVLLEIIQPTFCTA